MKPMNMWVFFYFVSIIGIACAGYLMVQFL